MTVVQGKQANLYVFRSGAFVPVACVKTVTFTISANLIEVATVDSGPNEDYESGFVGADVDLEGALTFDQTSQWQFHEFITNIRVKQRIKIEWIDTIGNSLVYDMNVLVQTASDTNPQKGFSGYNVSMKRCGAMTETFNGVTPGGGVTLGFDYTLDFDIE